MTASVFPITTEVCAEESELIEEVRLLYRTLRLPPFTGHGIIELHVKDGKRVRSEMRASRMANTPKTRP
jgi:hypothetical protein